MHGWIYVWMGKSYFSFSSLALAHTLFQCWWLCKLRYICRNIAYKQPWPRMYFIASASLSAVHMYVCLCLWTRVLKAFKKQNAKSFIYSILPLDVLSVFMFSRCVCAFIVLSLSPSTFYSLVRSYHGMVCKPFQFSATVQVAYSIAHF